MFLLLCLFVAIDFILSHRTGTYREEKFNFHLGPIDNLEKSIKVSHRLICAVSYRVFRVDLKGFTHAKKKNNFCLFDISKVSVYLIYRKYP